MISRIAVVCALLPVLLCAGSGHAAERRRVVIIPTELDGFFLGSDQYRRDVNLALEDRLRVAQFDIFHAAPAETDCREFDCMARASDMHNADIVVAGKITSIQQVTVSYRLRIRIVLRVENHLEQREREKQCDNCTEPEARDRLAKLMSATIANEHDEAAPPKVLPKTGGPELVHPKAETHRTLYLALGGVSAGLLVAGVVALVLEGTVVNGSCANDVPSGFACPTKTDATNGMIESGVAAAVGAVGTGVFFWLAHREHRKEQTWIAPMVGPRVSGMAIGGRF